jgi:dTMP kinase
MSRGRFFVLDGIDGVGKSTQIRRLSAALRRRGHRVTTVVDPGDTPLGKRIRGLLLGRGNRIAPAAEALLYAASRAQLVAERIRPALKKGQLVLSDRYSTATLAYQGALGLTRGLAEVCRFAEDGIHPDLTLILDCPPRRALNGKDRLEARGTAYQRRVRAGFLAQAKRDPRRIKVLPATGTPEEVTRHLLKLILPGLR